MARVGGRTDKGPKKPRVVFLCSDCGDTSVRWFGQCPSCGAWNTLKEFHPPADSE
ncbi:MAG: hypothetical protein KC729_17130, partial [Candidatus Eisenbacteria bacterium]|nr:hypothetical protein [Candidatus Eisenbacteria bacterium]